MSLLLSLTRLPYK